MARPGGLKRWIGLGALAVLALAPGALAQTPAPTVSVIPEPASAAPGAGPALEVRDGLAIVAGARDAEAQGAARELAELVLRTRGLKLPIRPFALGPAIRLIHRTGLAPEAYELKADAGGVRIEASDGAGLFYGAVSLWQLMTTQAGQGPAQVAPVSIQDGPRFRWRGLMLDSARHFQTPAEIERLVDWMAIHKLNVLHWHLTDDQGWRIQILKYPRLTEVGAWRTPPEGSPDVVLDPKTGRSRPYGGFYTQAEARRIVAYAAARHILVVPEIEMPGHALSALLAYPEFGAGPAPRAEDQTKWGGFAYVFGVDDRTFGFLQDVLTEIMAIFPSPYVHVGGDEAQAERWNGSPEVQARMAELHLADAPALQGAFTRRMAEYLKAHGRRLVGWDEIQTGGGLPGEAVVMSWHGVSGAAVAAAAGHDAILAPAPTLYFDNWQAAGADQPPGRGYLVPLKDVYGFEPMPAGADAATAGHILGLEAALWSEHIRTFDQLQAMAFPRAAALAEVGWSQPERRDWTSFLQRLPAEMDRYHALGLGADNAALALQAPVASDRRRASQELKLCNDKLALNLEGPDHRTYLTNPQDSCWIWPAAALDGIDRLTVRFARLPFLFALDPAHNSVVVRPPRAPGGEVEVRQDGCLSDPIAVAPVPPPGGPSALSLLLPARTGRHDLCVLFTHAGYDPMLALESLELAPKGAP